MNVRADRAATILSVGPPVVIAIVLLVGTLIGSGGIDHVALGVTKGPNSEPEATPGPRIVWRRSVDGAGAPMFADGPAQPIALDWGTTGIVLVAKGGSSDGQLWRSNDGIEWARLPELPGSDADFVVRDVVAFGKGWVVFGEDAEADTAMWTSTDGTVWKRTADARLGPFDGATIDDIVPGGDGLVAIGRAIDDAESDRIWTSPNGRRWRERVEFARAHAGVTLTAAGSMGNKFVTFGRAGTGKPAVWVGLNDTINGITRQWRGSEPDRPAPPSSFHVGRDGAIAIVDETLDGTPQLWRSINAGDWRRVERDEEAPPGNPPVYASDGNLIIADRSSPDGEHAFRVSTDGKTWRDVPSEGEVPSTTAPALLAARPSEIVVVTDDGIWQGSWVGRSDALPPRPTYPRPPVDLIGADPHLRAPVTRPEGEKLALDASGTPTAQSGRGGVRLEMWLPEGRVRTRDWLPAHVRITNVGSRGIKFVCGGAGTRAETARLFPAGKRWTGNAKEFKRRVLDQWPGTLRFGRQQGDGARCPGDVGLEIVLGPRGVYEYDVWTIPRYVVRDQPLPSGRLPVATTFSYNVAGDDTRRRLVVRDSVRLTGPRWPWATPQELIDAMLGDPRFKDWLDHRDRPLWWSNTTFHVVDRRSFYWDELGFEGPAPDGTVHIGLFAGSWTRFGGGYGRMLLDPWTGQVLGFAT